MICQQLGFKSLWKRQQLGIRLPWNVNDSGSSRSGYVNYLTYASGAPVTPDLLHPQLDPCQLGGKSSGLTSAPDCPRPCLANANSSDSSTTLAYDPHKHHQKHLNYVPTCVYHFFAFRHFPMTLWMHLALLPPRLTYALVLSCAAFISSAGNPIDQYLLVPLSQFMGMAPSGNPTKHTTHKSPPTFANQGRHSRVEVLSGEGRGVCAGL